VQWEVRGARITRVTEHVMSMPLDLFPEATPDDLTGESWLWPGHVDPAGRLRLSFHALVVDADDIRVVVDTGCGNDKRRPEFPAADRKTRPFLAGLSAVGIAPDSVDLVVNTHLHFDHVGWNTRLSADGWVPTFPRARYIVGAADLDHWADTTDPTHAAAYVDSVEPLVEAGRLDPVLDEVRLSPSLLVRPTPGHSPGHLSVWVGDDVVICGDVLHHPVQTRYPHWTGPGDADPDTARRTRRELLDEAAARQTLLFGGHWAGGSAGRVEPDGAGFRFVEEPGTRAS
jgi:glyoxylase-like metal-dependent hydrolase (beta-lactamase superfamily II)